MNSGLTAQDRARSRRLVNGKKTKITCRDCSKFATRLWTTSQRGNTSFQPYGRHAVTAFVCHFVLSCSSLTSFPSSHHLQDVNNLCDGCSAASKSSEVSRHLFTLASHLHSRPHTMSRDSAGILLRWHSSMPPSRFWSRICHSRSTHLHCMALGLIRPQQLPANSARV